MYRSRTHKVKRYKAKSVASSKIVGTRTKASVNKAVSYSRSKVSVSRGEAKYKRYWIDRIK